MNRFLVRFTIYFRVIIVTAYGTGTFHLFDYYPPIDNIVVTIYLDAFFF